MKLADILHVHHWEPKSVDRDGRTTHNTHVLMECACGAVKVKSYPGWHAASHWSKQEEVHLGDGK